MSYQDLTREQRATLLPELMLTGHMMDRAGMPYVLGEYGQESPKSVSGEVGDGVSASLARELAAPR